MFETKISICTALKVRFRSHYGPAPRKPGVGLQGAGAGSPPAADGDDVSVDCRVSKQGMIGYVDVVS